MTPSSNDATRRGALFELTRVRVLQFLREPEVVFWVFAFPIVLSAVLGFAFRKAEVQESRVGLPAAVAADALAERLAWIEHLEVERFADDEEAARALRKGVIDAWVEPDPEGVAPLVRIDLNRPEAEIARLRIARALELEPGAPEPYTLERVEERGSRYVDFLFPGLIGMNIMGTGMWLIGFAVADMRQKRVLRRMLVTPMRRSTFLMSLMASRLIWVRAGGRRAGRLRHLRARRPLPRRDPGADRLQPPRLGRLRRARHAGHLAREDDPGRVGHAQPGAGPDVAPVRSLLLVRAVPRRRCIRSCVSCR